MHWRRVLVVPLRFVGDTVLCVPMLRNLRQALGEDAQIDVWCSATAAPLLEPNPYARVLIEPKGTGARLRQLRETGPYDAAFLLRKSATTALTLRAAGVKTIVGYDKQRWPWGYKRWGLGLDVAHRYPSRQTDTHMVQHHLTMLEAVGLPVSSDRLELWTTPEDEATVDRLFTEAGVASDKPLAALHATSASHGKTVPHDSFAPALQRLHQQGYQVVATGLAADRPGYDVLAQTAGMPLVNLAGKTSLRQLVALYKRVQTLVSVDSASIHIAAAVGVPHVVGVYGPTNARQWAAYNPNIRFTPVHLELDCRPCYAKVCAHNRCKLTLPPEAIAAAL